MGLYQSATDLAASTLNRVSRLLNPQPFYEMQEMQAAFQHRANEVIKSLASGRVRLLPFYANIDGETARMRSAYRAMMREPTVRAAIYQIVLPTCFLNLEMEPASDHPIDKEAAEFIKDNIVRARGGIVALVEATLLGGMIEGYSVSEKVWNEQQIGRWAGRTMLKAIKARDTRHYQVEVDDYLNVTAIYGTLDQKMWPTSKFINHRNMPVYDHPAGTSEMKGVYRPCWMLDAIWKLRQAGLQRWSMPFLKATYPLGNKPIMQALETSLANAKGDGFLLMPQGATVDAMAIASGSQSDMAAAVSDLQQEILMGITLASLQSKEGATPSGAGDTAVHKEMSELRIWRNASDLAMLIDTQATPQLMEWNYPGRDYPRAMFSGVNEKDVLNIIAKYKGLQELGFPCSLSNLVADSKVQPAENEADKLVPFTQPVGAGSPPPSPGASPFKALPPAQKYADDHMTASGKV